MIEKLDSSLVKKEANLSLAKVFYNAALAGDWDSVKSLANSTTDNALSREDVGAVLDLAKIGRLPVEVLTFLMESASIKPDESSIAFTIMNLCKPLVEGKRSQNDSYYWEILDYFVDSLNSSLAHPDSHYLRSHIVGAAASSYNAEMMKKLCLLKGDKALSPAAFDNALLLACTPNANKWIDLLPHKLTQEDYQERIKEVLPFKGNLYEEEAAALETVKAICELRTIKPSPQIIAKALEITKSERIFKYLKSLGIVSDKQSSFSQQNNINANFFTPNKAHDQRSQTHSKTPKNSEEWDFANPTWCMLIGAAFIPLIGWAYLLCILALQCECLQEDNSLEELSSNHI